MRYGEVRRAVRQLDTVREALGAKVAVPLVPRAGRASAGRNAPCPCGSGKKYKRCCADRDAAAQRTGQNDAPTAR